MERTWRYSVGMAWTPGGAWSYRGGLAYDQTPVPSAELQSPRDPDSSRRWIAIGTSYRYSETFSVDIGFARLFEPKADINNTDSQGHQLTGSYDNSVTILSSQLNWAF